MDLADLPKLPQSEGEEAQFKSLLTSPKLILFSNTTGPTK